MRRNVGISLALFCAVALPAQAHYNMLLPEQAFGQKNKPMTFTYQWGHPFEHELFDAPAPDGVVVLGPDGKTTDLMKSLEKIDLPAGDKKVAAYRFRFTPEERGDYVFLLRTPPIWMEEDGEFLQDNVKVVLHVQAQKGWDGVIQPDFELTPLTRPYGLEPSMAFQAELRGGPPPAPLAGALVEIEHYHAAPPKTLPDDEFITRTAKTDPNGVVTATLTDPGWWCLTAHRQDGKKAHGDKSYPVWQRSVLWVYVDEKKADK